jgi:5'-3' exonuclease
MPSWDWFYPHFYAPLLSDIVRNCGNVKVSEWELGSCVYPFVQLCAVLPPQKSYLLPKEYRYIFDDGKMYPQKYDTDYAGTFREWEGVVKIPFIDISEIKTKCDKIENEDERNTIETSKDYVFRGDIVLNKRINI